MLGLPIATELNKQLPKKAIYAKFNMNPASKEKLDAEISKIFIVNEISPAKTALPEGENVKAIFVLRILLKKKDFDEKTIVSLTKLIPQNMILLLEYESEGKLAIFHQKLMQTAWQPLDTLTVSLKGLDLDAVWENIIVQIGSVTIEQGKTLDEQIVIDERKSRILKEIERLEKLARAEKQPKKKYELVQQINRLKEELEMSK